MQMMLMLMLITLLATFRRSLLLINYWATLSTPATAVFLSLQLAVTDFALLSSAQLGSSAAREPNNWNKRGQSIDGTVAAEDLPASPVLTELNFCMSS